nr:hypothetical protein Iba_chr03eCG0160 [Ipomoea batatas]
MEKISEAIVFPSSDGYRDSTGIESKSAGFLHKWFLLFPFRMCLFLLINFLDADTALDIRSYFSNVLGTFSSSSGERPSSGGGCKGLRLKVQSVSSWMDGLPAAEKRQSLHDQSHSSELRGSDKLLAGHVDLQQNEALPLGMSLYRGHHHHQLRLRLESVGYEVPRAPFCPLGASHQEAKNRPLWTQPLLLKQLVVLVLQLQQQHFPPHMIPTGRAFSPFSPFKMIRLPLSPSRSNVCWFSPTTRKSVKKHIPFSSLYSRAYANTVPVVKPELLPTFITCFPIRLLMEACKSMIFTPPISPMPFTDVVTAVMSKSSVKGMNAPSALTNVSAFE